MCFFFQNIVNTVGEEIKRLLEIFEKRNPTFSGKYSVCGHSLGRCTAKAHRCHYNIILLLQVELHLLCKESLLTLTGHIGKEQNYIKHCTV